MQHIPHKLVGTQLYAIPFMICPLWDMQMHMRVVVLLLHDHEKQIMQPLFIHEHLKTTLVHFLLLHHKPSWVPM
jgi:hypothetical protein